MTEQCIRCKGKGELSYIDTNSEVVHLPCGLCHTNDVKTINPFPLTGAEIIQLMGGEKGTDDFNIVKLVEAYMIHTGTNSTKTQYHFELCFLNMAWVQNHEVLKPKNTYRLSKTGIDIFTK